MKKLFFSLMMFSVFLIVSIAVQAYDTSPPQSQKIGVNDAIASAQEIQNTVPFVLPAREGCDIKKCITFVILQKEMMLTSAEQKTTLLKSVKTTMNLYEMKKTLVMRDGQGCYILKHPLTSDNSNENKDS
jgi:hypothetical protein